MQKSLLMLVIGLQVVCTSFSQQSEIDSLNKVITEYKDEAEVARAYNALGYEYTRTDIAKAKIYLQSAIVIGKKINNSKRLSSSYGQLVYLFHNTGKPDSAEYYLTLIKDLATAAAVAEKDIIYSVYYSTAALYYKKRGDYKNAIPFFERGIALNIKTGNKESTAGTTLNLGNVYSQIGNYQKATEQHLKALRLFEEINSKRGISFCYESLSNSFCKLKQYDKALLYASKTLKIKIALNDEHGLNTAQSGLGDIYFGAGDLDKALSHYKTSLNIAHEHKNIAEEQASYFNIAKVYVAKKDAARAIDYFNQSNKIAQQLRDSSSIASINAEIIALQTGIKKNTVSEKQLVTSVELFKQRGDLNRLAASFKNMVDFYTSTRQFEKALAYNDKYYATVDSIHNNELQLQVNKLNEQYNVEKKEQEIAILKKDQLLNESSLQKEKVIKYAFIIMLPLLLLSGLLGFNKYKLGTRMKQLEMRNQIAADLHDEVGSSLSSIHMLSQMATQPGNEAAHKNILARMSTNAKETIDKMGDIVWMIKPGETEAGSLKQRMERFAYDICSTKNIDVNMKLEDVEKVKLSMEQRKNIYLIFKEALNNAVKYSDSEKIEVYAIAQNNQLTLQVKDFGKGFSKGLVKKGNGLDNMQHRAKELGGVLKTETALNSGTTIQLVVQV